jgi:hypothetical protein
VLCVCWCVKDGVWQSGVWKMVGDKIVCERWWVTKLCVKDGGWQSCVWKMVGDKVVCEILCVCDKVVGDKDGGRRRRRRRSRRRQDTESKTRTPPKDVGNEYMYMCAMYIELIIYCLYIYIYVQNIYIYNHSSCSHWTPCQNEASLRPRCARCGLLHLLPGAPRRGVSGGSAGHAAAAAGQWRGRAQCGKW